MNKPEVYSELTDDEVVSLSRPLSTKAQRRHLVADSWKTPDLLEAAGDVRIVGRRVLPPLRSGDQGSSLVQ